MFRTRLSVLAIAANAAGLLASGYGGSVISPTSDHVTSAIPSGRVVRYWLSVRGRNC